MMIFKNRRMGTALFVAAVFIILSGCAKENPNLLNPPSQAETVLVRILNLGSDGKTRTLWMEGNVSTAAAPWRAVSPAIHPPADSAIIAIQSGGVDEIRQSLRMRFARSLNYTFVILPTPYESPAPQAVDTFKLLLTTSLKLPDERSAYLKMMNAYPDSTAFFSMRSGCQNGEIMFSSVGYGFSTASRIIRSDSIPVSVVMRKGNEEFSLGLFQLHTQSNGQYSIIIVENELKQPEVWLLDEMEKSAGAFYPLERLDVTTTSIRPINLSNKPLRFAKISGELSENIGGELNAREVGSFYDVGACLSNDMDTVAVYYNGELVAWQALSLEVLQRYTVIAADSANGKVQLIIVEPYLLTEATISRSVVRTVHADYHREGLTLSMGAKSNPKSAKGYSSGEVLAAEIVFGKVSPPVFISYGLTPLTLFTATTPAFLLFCSNYDFIPDASYLAVFSSDENASDSTKLAIIPDFMEDATVEFLPLGVFVQFLHGAPERETVNVNLSPVLQDAKIYYGNSFATVVPAGQSSIDISGVNLDFTANPDLRTFLIACGTPEKIEIYNITTQPLKVTQTTYKRRFINLSSTTSLLSVRVNERNNPYFIAERIAYKEVSFTETLTSREKVSLSFLNSDTENELRRVDELTFIPGKAYSFIFVGDASYKTGYNVFTQQEF